MPVPLAPYPLPPVPFAGPVNANQVAQVNCGNCQMLLMYQYGARSVKCAVCQFVTSVGVSIEFLSSLFGDQIDKLVSQ
uniref:Zinc finger LSD1-type domain-containing protein n=1 Tax=Daucus carota subsp. sativus TaxID=79200 RepID=A0A166D6A4_DAUCS